MKGKANVLIVDDEEVVRLSHLRSLAGADIHAETACDGSEAIRFMEQQPFDVVLLDLRMPDRDGISILKEIREKWSDCEVVIVTGYPSIHTAKEAVRLGAYHYLVKPVGPGDVVKAANDAITHKNWAIRSEAPVCGSVKELQSRAWLREVPDPTDNHGGKS